MAGKVVGLGLFLTLLLGACGEVRRPYEEVAGSDLPGDAELAATGTSFEESLEKPLCKEEDSVYHASAKGYLLRSLAETWSFSRTDHALHWKSAKRLRFSPVPERAREGDHSVFFTVDSNTITWDIEWHHRLLEGTESDPRLVKIAYAMVRSDTVPFITPLKLWKGALLMRAVAPGVTALSIENYISGHVNCTDSSGAVTDLFRSLQSR